MTENDQNICKLLLAIAGGDEAQKWRHDIIFRGAAESISRLTAERDGLRKALERIERWFGEFPETGEYWDRKKTEPMSYAACYGSNGERDFMRGIARDAISLVSKDGESVRGRT